MLFLNYMPVGEHVHTNQCPRKPEVSVPGEVVVAGVSELPSVGDED